MTAVVHIHSSMAIPEVGTLCGDGGSSVHLDSRDHASDATCERCLALAPSYRNGSPARERIRALEAALVEALEIADWIASADHHGQSHDGYERIAELRKLMEAAR